MGPELRIAHGSSRSKPSGRYSDSFGHPLTELRVKTHFLDDFRVERSLLGEKKPLRECGPGIPYFCLKTLWVKKSPCGDVNRESPTFHRFFIYVSFSVSFPPLKMGIPMGTSMGTRFCYKIEALSSKMDENRCIRR